MRIRVKFSKQGVMKYIGHLDTMRFFQKALRRAGFDVAYSEGFSPHMLMSFASPLGVGLTSEGEYFDLDMKNVKSSGEMLADLNAQMNRYVEIKSIVKIPEDKANKCMTLVAAAAYDVDAVSACPLFSKGWQERFASFLKQKEIHVMRKTKRKEEETDIRPWIYDASADAKGLHLLLSAGSVSNLKPETVLEAFGEYLGVRAEILRTWIHRKELYADRGNRNHQFIPLDRLGESIE